MPYDLIDVKPVAGALGAEVFGVDLSRPVSNSVADEIQQAFADHLVLFFRDQKLDGDALLRVSAMFGTPNEYPFAKGLESHPKITPLVKNPEDRANFGGGAFHADTTYLENVPVATALYGLEIPPAGGDTLFANMYMAYETLSEGMKRLIDPLVGVSSAGAGRVGDRKKLMNASSKSIQLQNLDKLAMEAEHPAVRVHEKTGRKALFVNYIHTLKFKGWTEAESEPVLQYLFKHLRRPEFTCRLRWQPGTLAVWDNLASQHYPINDYDGHRRVMWRVTLEAA
jgi:taurine dioxygenase